MNWIDLLKVLPPIEDDPDPPLRSGFQLGAPAPQTGRNYYDTLTKPDPRKVARQRSFDAIPQRAANVGRAALDFVPGIGDALAVKDAVGAARGGNWLTAGLSAASILPFVPNLARKAGERISEAAIRSGDNLYTGPSHADAYGDYRQHLRDAEQENGFVTDAGRFVGREEALEIAGANKQVAGAAPPAWAEQGLHARNLTNAAPRSLPMDEASRMQRARDMGFDVDTPLFHGTSQSFDAFDVSRAGTAAGDESERAVFMATRPEVAGHYAELFEEGSNVMPLLARGRFKDVDMPAYRTHRVMQALEDARNEAFDGVRFRNMKDSGAWNEGADQIAVFDPKNIRSRFAKFDPEQSHLPDLLASVGGITLLNAARQKQNERGR